MANGKDAMGKRRGRGLKGLRYGRVLRRRYRWRTQRFFRLLTSGQRLDIGAVRGGGTSLGVFGGGGYQDDGAGRASRPLRDIYKAPKVGDGG